MKYVIRKGRLLLVTLVMLFSAIALNLSNTVNAEFVDQCDECRLSCSTEAYNLYYSCLANGGSNSACFQEYTQYYNNCNRLFCRYGGLCSVH
jgi:K+-transporting ATPase A subunit